MQLTNVGCNGSESNLTSCCVTEIPSGVYCHSGAYAGVRCKLSSDCMQLYTHAQCHGNCCHNNYDLLHMIGAQCIENDIQLVGELSQTVGYVLICFEGAWGKIRYGNPAAATVVCRQLGLSTESQY